MTELNKLLDKAKETRSLSSDAALAASLGLKRQSVFQWRQGGAIGNTQLADLIALANAPESIAIAVHAEQAKSAAERRLWSRLARQLGVAATLAVATLLPFTSNAGTSLTDAPTRHYAKL